MTKPTTYYAQNEAIDALVEQYGSQLEQLTKPEKFYILEALTEMAHSWCQPRLKSPSPALETHLLDVLTDSSESDLLSLIVAIASQIQAGKYAP